MVAIKLELLLFLNILYVTDGVRRITDGKDVQSDKRYVVYLVKAPASNKKYDEWLCGGALVSSWFIITSAACVADVEFMYAIAGYKEYIKDNEIETNQCTKGMKKKVIYTCVPMKYELDHKVEKWSFIDIALVKVESEYDFNDATYKTLCSYIPTVIGINYLERFQKPGTDTLVYGWGHPKSWRAPDDKNNYNQHFMQFAGSKIIHKPMCKTHYENFANMSELIDQYMICTFNQGEITDKGEFVILKPAAFLEGCKDNIQQLALVNGEIVPSPDMFVTNDGLVNEDVGVNYQDLVIDATRRGDENTNQTSSASLQKKNRIVSNRTTRRRYGICQIQFITQKPTELKFFVSIYKDNNYSIQKYDQKNDHGGPLVTWVGGHEILIGVASVFKVDDELNCKGPYLFTSTQCNGAFINCILNDSSIPNRRVLCDSPPIQRGYDTVEKYISWENHPSGPAYNQGNGNEKHEKERKDLDSPQALQRLLRFNMLVKMAKDQTTKILRQQRQRVC